jgi:hypothetical protein
VSLDFLDLVGFPFFGGMMAIASEAGLEFPRTNCSKKVAVLIVYLVRNRAIGMWCDLSTDQCKAWEDVDTAVDCPRTICWRGGEEEEEEVVVVEEWYVGERKTKGWKALYIV